MKLILKLLIVFLIGISPAFPNTEIDECQTDLWFGNGVWNTYADVTKGQEYQLLPRSHFSSGNEEMLLYHFAA